MAGRIPARATVADRYRCGARTAVISSPALYPGALAVQRPTCPEFVHASVSLYRGF